MVYCFESSSVVTSIAIGVRACTGVLRGSGGAVTAAHARQKLRDQVTAEDGSGLEHTGENLPAESGQRKFMEISLGVLELRQLENNVPRRGILNTTVHPVPLKANGTPRTQLTRLRL